MAIDWDNFEFLEKFLKKNRYLKNETIERTVILLNLDNDRTLKGLKRKIRKVGAFNEYLMFRELREKCHKEDCIVIKSPKDLLYKIDRLDGQDPYLKRKLVENYKEFNKSLSYPSLRKWDIAPVFNLMAENFGFIEYKKTKEKDLYRLSGKGRAMRKDLIQGFRGYGILKFCYNKKEDEIKDE